MVTRNNILAGMATVLAVLAVGVVAVAAFQPDPQNSRRSSSWSSRLFSSFAAAPTLPSDVVKYSQVPKEGVFTAQKIPKGLLKDHTTKAGTWGVIRVSQGTLEYTILKPKSLVLELTAPATGVIEPQRLHHVKALTDNVEFVVEFYRKPGTGPVDEKREGL